MLDIFRQVNWIVFIPHGILLTLITLLLLSLGVKNDLALLVAAFIYMGLSMLLHAVIPTNHRLGITLLKQGNFEAAKKSFDKSYEYFTRNKWLDDYRSIFILSASKMSYKEMAMINAALCLLRMDDLVNSKMAYQKVLTQFPDSFMAKNAISYIEDLEKESKENDNI
jgi:hypothetical protein